VDDFLKANIQVPDRKPGACSIDELGGFDEIELYYAPGKEHRLWPCPIIGSQVEIMHLRLRGSYAKDERCECRSLDAKPQIATPLE
jgi:hypothetical protein